MFGKTEKITVLPNENSYVFFIALQAIQWYDRKNSGELRDEKVEPANDSLVRWKSHRFL